MGLREDILAFLVEQSGLDQESIDTSDVLTANGIDGDDATAFLFAFAGRFDVDMIRFRYYFHYDGDEPPGYRRVSPRDPKGKVHPLIPISLDMLVTAAAQGRWEYDYPAFTLRTTLLPAWVSRILKIALAAWILFWVIRLLGF